MARVTPTDDQLLEWYDTLSNWGRWGDDDLLGTLNLITPEKRRQAGALIQEGISVSCGLPIRFDEHNLDDFWPEPRRFMQLSPTEEELSPDFVGRSATADVVLLNCHGLTLTHLDCPGHSFFRPAAGRPLATFNGLPASVASAQGGVTQGDITLAGDGIVSRGVLLDIARLRGVDWLEPRTKISPRTWRRRRPDKGLR